MNALFRRLAGLRPAGVLAAHTVLLLVMLAGMSRLTLRNNDDADLPANDPIVQTNKKFEAIFGGKDRVLIGLESADAFSPGSLTATREITDAFVGLKWVVGNEIKSLSTIKNIEANADGLDVDTLYDGPPLSAADAADVRRKALANPLIQGRVVSDDGTDSLILINVVRGSDQAQVFEDTYRILEPYRDRFTVRVIGDLILSEAIDRGIQDDAVVLFPIGIFVQLLILWAIFRNVRLVAASVLATVVGIAWTMGLMGWLGYPVTVVTTSIPILIAVTAGSYAIYYLHALLEERLVQNDLVTANQSAMSKVAYPLWIACLTSAVGAYSLIVFKVSAIAELGVVTAIGTVASLIVVITLLPALIRCWWKDSAQSGKPTGLEASSRIMRWAEAGLTRLAAASVARPVTTLIAYVVLLGMTLVSLTFLRTGANFAEYLPDGHPIKTDMAYFDARLGGSRYFDVLVEAGANEGVQDPAFLRRVEAIQRYAETLPSVGHTLSFVDVLTRIDGVMNNKPAGEIPATFDQAAQYLLLYSISSSPEDFSDLVDYDYRRVKIFIPVKTSEQDTHIAIYRQLKDFIAQQPTDGILVEYGGNLLVWLAQMDYIIIGKIQNIISSVITIVLLCAFFFRSLRYALLAAAPIVLAILATFALMAVLGLRLEVSTAVITGITIGIGIDFSYHFLYHYRRARERSGDAHAAIVDAIQASGAAILFTVVVTVLGFTAFIFSAFTPIQNFGYLVSVNMIFSGLATFTLIPALLAVRRPQAGVTPVMAVETGHAGY
ncbi:hydrophobe/amphiphile efflux-3 (HAE3) family protein [Tahibacter aquaticus]|uniref:Hydrophobe/amphiphile efflux-3 (HAE3) family protein n=1 Tax=Tahibacter aquaticus TaxID=520092 RepID=A0A4R6Z2B3_9GAMM|nr:MMPL family transporter [Tahibacter aquaticus]TDR45634.1 hydrophobe/amphiphile efflux-3 (HAE3) family protein [Tahibacter aquaticus]